jgi:Cu2+-exporting ATPase
MSGNPVAHAAEAHVQLASEPMFHGHSGHGLSGYDHTAMVADFRRRFWVSLVITVPVLALAPMLQGFLGLRATLAFPGDSYVVFGLSAAVYF